MNSKTKATKPEVATLEADVVQDLEFSEIEKLRAENEALKAKIASKDEEIGKLTKRDEGWLVMTPNPIYDGVTAGVKFTDGMAFVPKQRVFTAFDGTAKMTVDYLVHDFGYLAEYFTKDQMEELQTKLTVRAQERKELEARLGDARTQIEKILEAHHF